MVRILATILVVRALLVPLTKALSRVQSSQSRLAAALAAAVRRATEKAGSKRTVQRALKELVEEGYLTYTTANGRFRQIGPDNWIPEQICIYTLTDKALAIWTYTSIPMTECRGDDQKNTENKSQIFARDQI